MEIRTVFRHCRVALRHHRSMQVGLVIGFWAIGEGVVRLLRLPIPGGILGLALLLALLANRTIRRRTLRDGADWLIAEMLLFFVPAVMAITEHRELLSSVGLKLIAAIVAGTILVMLGTAMLVEFCERWRLGHGHA